MRLFKNKPIRERIAKKEKHPAEYIPYHCHWNHNTILTKKNELLQVIQIGGFSFETADDEDLDIRKNIRNSLLKTMTSGSIKLSFYTIRRSQSIVSKKSDPTLKTSHDFLSNLSKRWDSKYSTQQSFFNELYISVLYTPDTAGAALIEHLVKKLQQGSNKSAWEESMREMYANIDEVSNRLLSAFSDYDSRLLGVKKSPHGGHFCEILGFLGTLVNCGYYAPMMVPQANIDQYLPNQRLFFGSRAIEANGTIGSRYAGIIGIFEYAPSTSVGMFDVFLQMPFSFVMTQSFSFANRSVAISKMQLQQNRMIQAEDKAVSQIAEISQALDMAMSGNIGFGEHHFSLLCIADSPKELENIISMASVELANNGIQSIREVGNMEAAYWSQLPGNSESIVRKATINTLNMASFASIHNYPLGKIYGNHWGEYVTIMDTTSGTPFYFNFHLRDVGHSLIIGPTGSGKTVLMNFLCAQAQKFKPRMFFFDKDHGAEIFIRAINGLYTVIDPGVVCNFNPLQLENTGENRTFLLDWLKVLVTSNGETINAEDIKLLNQALDGNFRLDKKDRKLSNIVPFLGMDGPGTLAGRIAMWHSNGSHAKIFDNDNDNIDLNAAKVFGFEMAELLKDSTSLSPVLLYIFHRINISLDGTPTMIVLDEAWALIDNPVFAPKIKDWLKVLRKLNTFVIFATQSVEDAAKSQISDTLIQQTATQIFLPNLKATNLYRSAFMLSQREYTLIKTTDPSSRYFLVKQGVNAVIAKVNLSGMDDIVHVLSARAETITLLNRIIAEHGSDPEQWLSEFYSEVKEL